jgi:hypothetical protein
MHKAINLSNYKTLSKKRNEKLTTMVIVIILNNFKSARKCGGAWIIRARKGCTQVGI